MLQRAILLLVFAASLSGAVVVDRVAVIVGRRVVKTSDIDRDLRVSSFLNRQPPDQSPAARRKAAERLIDQELVRQELRTGQYAQPTEQEAAEFLQQLKRDRFGSSDSGFNSELQRHRLTDEQLKRHLLWQLSVLRFIDQRFRPGVLVTDEDVAAYYRENRAKLEKSYPQNNSLEALTPRIRETLTAQRVDQAFEEWLAEARKATRIEYREQAFSAGVSR
jgi:hypothetical protein